MLLVLFALLRPRVWLGVVVANSMVMTFYVWNMTVAVLAAVILLPTRIASQFEELSGAWWLWRLGWIAACAVCLVPFLFAFRWAERPDERRLVPLVLGFAVGSVLVLDTPTLLALYGLLWWGSDGGREGLPNPAPRIDRRLGVPRSDAGDGSIRLVRPKLPHVTQCLGCGSSGTWD
jgi:hypothetical protein